MKRRFLTVILAVGVLLTITGCGQQTVEVPQDILIQEDEEEAYPTTTVEPGDVVKNITIRCQYLSTDKQELSFPVNGKLIERVEVKLGDYVSAGKLLAALDIQDLEEQIEELEYQVETQELRIKQTEEMKAFDLDSAEVMFGYTYQTRKDREALENKKAGIEEQYKTTLEDMSDQLTLLKQRLQQAREEWDAGQLIADITGEITFIDAGMQDTYSVKDRVVVTVSNLDECYFITDTTDYSDFFHEGESFEIMYRISGDPYTCEAVPAHMDSWEEMGQMYFKPLEEEIIPSKTNGTITMELDRREQVLSVPKLAIHESDQGPFVYLVEDGLLEMRYVTIGLEGDTLVEITEGLKQGEVVALKK